MSEQRGGHRFLEFAFLCDAASDKGGALDALGIGTTLVFAQSLPAMHQLTLVLRVAWTGGPITAGPKVLNIEVKDPNGEPIAAINGHVGLAEPLSNPHPEIPVGANLILPLPLQLRTYGLHHIEISFEGDTYTPLPLKVVDPNASE